MFTLPFPSAKILVKCSFIWLAYTQLQAQHIHSHNDYQQKTPLYSAFASQAESIEIDIVLDKKKLYVAHEKESIQFKNTLEEMYLLPLQSISKQHSKQLNQMQLVIDIKTEAYATMAVLVTVLERYKQLWQKGLVVIISGKQPHPKDFKKYPDYIFFDYQAMDNLSNIAWKKVGMCSTSFRSISKWNGKGKLADNEKVAMQKWINMARLQDKPIRFWATPDSKTAWQTLIDLGVDFINTDNPIALRNFLSKQKANHAHNKQPYKIDVLPLEAFGNKKPKNIILCIGDGMGLGVLTAASIANNNSLYITKMPYTGLIATNSADAICTDSAAGATAFATGTKSNNRAIGVDRFGNDIENVTELLATKGYTNAIITTDEITGATPAAFYAHVKDRAMEMKILKQLEEEAPIEYFIASGQKNHPKYNKLKYSFTDWHLAQPKESAMSIRYFKNRMDLSAATTEMLAKLQNNNHAFFLLLEGANIDNSGHANRLAPMIEALYSFDLAVAQALQYAFLKEDTLVLVTADHETGGLTLLDGSLEKHQINGHFSSQDHTATMVPIFAYGPGAEKFTGVYSNTELYAKILKLF